jgi:hypothetical protein
LVHTQHRHHETDHPFRIVEHQFREPEQTFRHLEQPFRNTSESVRLQPKRVFIFQRKPCSASTEMSVRLRRNTHDQYCLFPMKPVISTHSSVQSPVHSPALYFQTLWDRVRTTHCSCQIWGCAIFHLVREDTPNAPVHVRPVDRPARKK